MFLDTWSMPFQNEQWRIEFFTRTNGHVPVQEYLETLDEKYQAKIVSYIELLRAHGGKLYEPYAKHIKGSIWELRIDFSRLASRIFYFLATEKRIVLLHAFMKKTEKTPAGEIERAQQYYSEYLQQK